jgi:hypothetical protein
MFHADRQTDRRTDMMKLIFAFRSFANAPKNDLNFMNFLMSYYVLCLIYVI